MSIIDDYKNSSDSRKLEILQEIEFEDYPEKWELVKRVIADKAEYDLARLEALKILEIAALPNEEIVLICELLVSIINTDEDYDVKNYAVIAAKNFVNDSGPLKTLIIKIVLDPEEDIDIRHNAYDAVQAFFDLPGRKAVLEKLTTDKDFSRIASMDLREIRDKK